MRHVKAQAWNSLEIAKLVIGASTSIAIAVAGIVLAVDTNKREETVRNQAIARDQKLRHDADLREKRTRVEAEGRDDRIRLEAEVRDQKLRAEAEQLEDRRRNEDHVRNLQMRAQNTELQRYMVQVQRRMTTWDKLSPCLAQAHSAAVSAAREPKRKLPESDEEFIEGLENESAVANKMQACSDIYLGNSAYFSKDFKIAYLRYSLALSDYNANIRATSISDSGMLAVQHARAWQQLHEAAESDLALLPGSLGEPERPR